MRLLRFLLMGSSILVLTAMVLHIVLEITLRAVFDSSTFILDEYVGYGLAFITFVPLGIVFADGAMLRVDLVKVSPGTLTGRLIAALNLLLAGGVAAFTLYALFDLARRNFLRGTISQTIAATPLWLPMSLAVIGMAGLLAAIVIQLVRTVTASAENLEESSKAAMTLE